MVGKRKAPAVSMSPASLKTQNFCQNPAPGKDIRPMLVEIFNKSQHVHSANEALNQIQKLYKNTEYKCFELPFKNCFKKLLQSEHTIYFKTSCEFVCKFLQHVSKLADEAKVSEPGTVENTAPQTRGSRRVTRSSLASECSPVTPEPEPKRGRQTRRGRKRKSDADEDEDELIHGFLSTTDASMQADSPTTDADSTVRESVVKRRKSTITISGAITDHDRLVSACIDVADIYMQVADENCRVNAVFFICKFLAHVESLDEEICSALKLTLPRRIRDRKPMIRAQAVLASRTFQDNKLTQEAFLHHFQRDPELTVRKALLQIMDTKVFGFDFLVESTQDAAESMRKAAFQRLGKLSPSVFSQSQLHCILHNGLNERERQVSYFFKTHTLDPWLKTLYDGQNLYKLIEPFDLINHHDDVCRLLEVVYMKALDEVQNSGATTKLHHLVESFREQWLITDGNCLPKLDEIDERVVTIWLTLLNFCKSNQGNIKSIKIRTLLPQSDDQDDTIEKITNSQENNDEVAELYERVTPDLVNLVEFLKLFVRHFDTALNNKIANSDKVGYIYNHLMNFAATYEIGDELERKTVQEVLGLMLKENLLTGRIDNYIPPIIRCLFKLIYHSSSDLMIHYISELINNVRSHLEDLVTSTQINALTNSAIAPPKAAITRSAKKSRDGRSKRVSYAPELDQHNLEFKIATIRVDLEELRDQYENCIKVKDFDGAKAIDNKMNELKHEQALLHDRRCSIASDVSHMSMVIETGTGGLNKLSSTMIGDTSISENQPNTEQKEENFKIFRHHTNELIKCLQMYLGCLQHVRITEVPQTMLNHLMHLTCESMDEWFIGETRVRSLMILCNGVTALVDKEYAKETTTITLLLAACRDPSSIEIRTVGYNSLVDMLCRHEDLDIPVDKVEEFLNIFLRDYGKYDPNTMKKIEYDFLTALIEGTCKLYYYKKLSSPEIFSHLILWWYHPKTHSRLRQFIGIFLPTFVNDLSREQNSTEENWLRDLLEETFVISIENLHDYILGSGFNIMAAPDMQSLVNFLCNLIPIAFHPKLDERVDLRIDELTDEISYAKNPKEKTALADLLRYLKQSKNILASMAPINKDSTTLARPIQTP